MVPTLGAVLIPFQGVQFKDALKYLIKLQET